MIDTCQTTATSRAWAPLAMLAGIVGGCYTSFADGSSEDVVEDEPDSMDADDYFIPDSGGRCPVQMVYVPAGPFLMGCQNREGDPWTACGVTLGWAPVTLSAYCIGATEVTNAEYAQCVAASRCSPPSDFSAIARASYYDNLGFADFPVVYVSWNDARDYCDWIGGRLPTQAEWEKAAKGGCEITSPSSCGAEDRRVFPWGDALPTCDQAEQEDCIAAALYGSTRHVGILPEGASPYGVSDLADNVVEYASDWFESMMSLPDSWWYRNCAAGCTDPQGPPSSGEGSPRRVVRGALNGDPGWAMAVGIWLPPAAPPDDANAWRGFRCAANPNE